MPESKYFESGQTIFNEGDVGDVAYLIKDGSVKITKIGHDDCQKTIAPVGKGAILGEMALIDDDTRSATAIVLFATEVMVIEREELVKRLERTDPVVNRLLQTLSARLKEQAETIAKLSV